VPDSTTLTNGIVHAVPRLVGGKGGENLRKHNFFQIMPIMHVMVPLCVPFLYYPGFVKVASL
jgi:hypothetical protein